MQVAAAVCLRPELLRHISALQRIHLQFQCLLVELLPVYSHRNALFLHAAGNFNDIFQCELWCALKIQFDVVDAIQNPQIPRRKLKLIDRDLVSLLRVLLYHPHSQRMNDHTVIDLNDQFRLVKQPGGLFHQQSSGKRHKIQGPPKELVCVQRQEIVDGVCCGEIAGARTISPAEGLILAIVLDLIADDPVFCILDGLADNIFAVHRLPSCFRHSPRAIS